MGSSKAKKRRGMGEHSKRNHQRNTHEGHSPEMQALNTLRSGPKIVEPLPSPMCYQKIIGFLEHNSELSLKEQNDTDSLWGLLREPQSQRGDESKGLESLNPQAHLATAALSKVTIYPPTKSLLTLVPMTQYVPFFQQNVTKHAKRQEKIQCEEMKPAPVSETRDTDVGMIR